jgi:hypothetical protein
MTITRLPGKKPSTPLFRNVLINDPDGVLYVEEGRVAQDCEITALDMRHVDARE